MHCMLWESSFLEGVIVPDAHWTVQCLLAAKPHNRLPRVSVVITAIPIMTWRLWLQITPLTKLIKRSTLQCHETHDNEHVSQFYDESPPIVVASLQSVPTWMCTPQQLVAVHVCGRETSGCCSLVCSLESANELSIILKMQKKNICLKLPKDWRMIELKSGTLCCFMGSELESRGHGAVSVQASQAPRKCLSAHVICGSRAIAILKLMNQLPLYCANLCGTFKSLTPRHDEPNDIMFKQRILYQILSGQILTKCNEKQWCPAALTKCFLWFLQGAFGADDWHHPIHTAPIGRSRVQTPASDLSILEDRVESSESSHGFLFFFKFFGCLFFVCSFCSCSQVAMALLTGIIICAQAIRPPLKSWILSTQWWVRHWPVLGFDEQKSKRPGFRA